VKTEHKVLVLLMFSSLLSVCFLTRHGFVYSLEVNVEMEMKPDKEPMSATSDYNASRNSSLTEAWHTADVWTMTLVAVVPFSSVDLLKTLSNSSDKQHDILDKSFTPETLYGKARTRKRIHKLRKFLGMIYSTVLWSDILFLLEFTILAVVFWKF
jgi:hypothetical protein